MKDKSKPDYLLKYLLQVVNTDIMRIGITLFVNGPIVSGILISEKKYFSNLLKTIGEGKATANPTTPEYVKNENLRIFVDGLYGAKDLQLAQSQTENEFIHLEDISVNGVKLGVTWRGKASSIDGYFIGELSMGTDTGQKEHVTSP
jgi:hypothetical protein